MSGSLDFQIHNATLCSDSFILPGFLDVLPSFVTSILWFCTTQLTDSINASTYLLPLSLTPNHDAPIVSIGRGPEYLRSLVLLVVFSLSSTGFDPNKPGHDHRGQGQSTGGAVEKNYTSEVG